MNKYFSDEDLVSDCLLFINLLCILPMEIWTVFFCSQLKQMDIERRNTVSVYIYVNSSVTEIDNVFIN